MSNFYEDLNEDCHFDDIVEKIANPISNAVGKATKGVGNFGNALGRSLTAGAIVGGYHLSGGLNPGEDDPNVTIDQRMGENMTKAIGGGIAAGALVGPGAHYGKKTINKIKNIATKVASEEGIEVPTKEEIKKEIGEQTDDKSELEKSLEKDEFEKRKEKYKDLIEKEASKLIAIKCENCDYEGLPDEKDGRCPECGAMCGSKPIEMPLTRTESEYNRDIERSEYEQAVQESNMDTLQIYL